MPELPEVEAVCRKLRGDAIGLTVIRCSIERPGMVHPHAPGEIETALQGATITRVERRGKNILLSFDNGRLLHVHLRMTGNLLVIPDVRFRTATTRVWFELSDGRGLSFEDPRALGRMALIEQLEDIGIEPLSPEFTAEAFARLAARSRKPAKLFLMDQRLVAGLGNIYVAEALFRSAIHPARAMNRISRMKLNALHGAIIDVLREGVESAVQAYSKPGAFGEAEEFACAVYGREGEPCLRCKRRIKRIAQGGRSTYFCPGCQR